MKIASPRSLLFLVTAFAWMGSMACGQSQEGILFFEKHIRPALSEHCYECHSTKAGKSKGGLFLDTRAASLRGGDTGPAVVPKKPSESLLLEAIRYEGDYEMPPKYRLPAKVVNYFEQWIRMGAPDPREEKAGTAPPSEIDIAEGRKFWAFQPLQTSSVPARPKSGWPKSDIDVFVQTKLKEEGLKPTKDTDRRTLLRRIYFDLVGLPPSPEQQAEFLSDNSPEAFEKVVDRLLASSQFAERWGRHWLDVARYGESTGMERNNLFPEAWRYRDYVLKSFHEDKPYNQFIREQIAGDLLPSNSQAQRDEQITATGFLAMGPKSLNERQREQFLMDVVDEQIDVSCRAVLGLTVACARCHDHKFDPIPTSDYYALAGIFRSTDTKYGTSKSSGNRQVSSLEPIGAELETRAAQKKKHAAEVSALNKKVTVAKKEFNKVNTQFKSKKEKPNAWKVAKKKMDDLNKQMAALKKKTPAAPEMTMAVADASKPADTAIRLRGEPGSRGKVVPRGFLQVLPAEDCEVDPKQSGRLQLAEWMVGGENPLAARVMTNRVWHWLLGRGLVRTVDNFGETGTRPSHPELLDHLSGDFIENGWSVKKLIRQIVLSRTYQLSSTAPEDQIAKDPENQFLGRAHFRRLDAEALRDSMLAASGTLNLDHPGKSFVKTLGNVNIGRDVKKLALLRKHDSPHRSLYLPIVRSEVPEALRTFDFAEPSVLVGSRDVTTVATQALYLLNSDFVINQSGKTGNRLVESASNPRARIDLAYELILGRGPTSLEQEYALQFIDGFKDAPEKRSWAALSQALFASAEFRYLR